MTETPNETTQPPTDKTILWPSSEQIRDAFEAYVEAVGRVAHAWNYLFEKLERLFEVVSGIDERMARAIWYASDNDRVLIDILKATTLSASAHLWTKKPTAQDDVLWLVERIRNLHDARNNAIHAPCSFVVDHEGTEMAASFFTDHKRAKNLRGKSLLVEFDWCEKWTERLSTFSVEIERSLISVNYPWPKRPSQPNRQPKKALLDQRRLLRSK
jgi:hypothetical protein